ncbi:hypothetical protein PFI31113_00875 [Pandoraea fibrosis]|uniref:Uncharacterized protein n=1 Tax=Pandoraea fibrosis TaxID=1891094 RepID=A0A5E4SQ46_9BURK|nr:hypothetical protein PFI31113_00875 [Pandoraea fibrosis]
MRIERTLTLANEKHEEFCVDKQEVNTVATIIVEMHHSDYENIERAATLLGYSNIDMMKLCSHLIASAVNRDEQFVSTPIPRHQKD